MLPRFRLPQPWPDAGLCSCFRLPERPRHHWTGFPPCQALTRSGPHSDPEASRRQLRSQTHRRLPWHASPGSDAQTHQLPYQPGSRFHSRKPLPVGTLFRFFQDTPYRTRRPGSGLRCRGFWMPYGHHPVPGCAPAGHLTLRRLSADISGYGPRQKQIPAAPCSLQPDWHPATAVLNWHPASHLLHCHAALPPYSRLQRPVPVSLLPPADLSPPRLPH